MSGDARCSAPGNPPLHRFRVGLEFALSGHREVDDMIAQHAAMARALGEQLGLPDARARGARRRVRAVGRQGLARASSRGDGDPARGAARQLAEFVEVAHRVGGVDGGAGARPASGAAGSSTRRWSTSSPATRRRSSPASTRSGTWDAVIDAEPALAVVLSGEQFDAALLAIANFVDLKSPYTLGHARAVAELAAAAGAAARAARGATYARCAAPASCTTSAGSASRTRSGTSPGRSAPASGSACGMHPYLTERMLQQSAALAPLGAIAVQHRERLDGSGYPRGLVGRRDLAAGADPRRGRRLPGDARAAPAPPAALADDAAAELRAEVKAGRLDAEAVEAVLGAAGHRVPRRRDGPGRAHRARGRGAAAARPRPVEQGDRRAARDLAEDRGNHIEHIYAKIGASSRATASLFAMQHGLLPEEELAGAAVA